jgi:hypothetical protein
MAGPLRRVSQNYHWTIKRAHNDLHNSITPDLAPSPNIESVVLPWDSDRLQLKFKSEYDELREHLGHSLFILLGWWLTIKHLTKAAAEHFIAHPDQAIFSLYKQSTKLPIHDTLSISVGVLVALFRYAVLRIVFPTQPFFSRSVSRFGASKGEETGTNPALLPSTSQPLPDESPVQSPYTESTAHASPEDSPTITVTSDTAHAPLDGSLMDALKDGIEMLHSAMHMGDGRHIHGSPSLDGDIK